MSILADAARPVVLVILMGILLGILTPVNLHHEAYQVDYSSNQEADVLPAFENYVRQRMTDGKGLWRGDMKEYKDFIVGFFSNKKYVVEVTPKSSNSKIKKINVKIAEL